MKTVYLSLGSNLGDREANLGLAIARLEEEGVRVVRSSSIYETEPQYLREQPWFLNQVVEAETDLFPRQVLTRAKRIEREMGRRPGPRNTARPVDIDILFYGSAVIKMEDFEVPHPGIAERRFVLEPLAELAPELRHPETGRSVQEMLSGLAPQGVRRLVTPAKASGPFEPRP